MSNTIDPRPGSSAELRIRPAATARGFGRSLLRELLASAERPGVLSFAVGMPAVETFPTGEAADAARQVAAEGPGLQYGMPCARLKRQVVALMAKRGVDCSPEQVFLTAGAQQGMDLIARLLAEPGDRVLVERTVYEGARLALASRGARIETVATGGARGLDVDALERRLTAGPPPAYLFLIPDGHNPLGVDLPASSRERLVELARRHALPLVEDDAYGHLRYGGPATRPLRALDDRWVIYLGTFSKIVAPALRVGWIVAPEALMPALSTLKHGSDLDSATYSQRVLSRLLDSFDLDAHCAWLRRFYRRRRDALATALERHFGERARWHRPAAGFYVWLELPVGFDAVRLLRSALERERVAFCPGAAFAAPGDRTAARCLRLSFARLTPEEIEDGVGRLRRAVDHARPGRRAAVAVGPPARGHHVRVKEVTP